MSILGIWDGHDSGAALLAGNDILFAINEERLTRRKLEIAFPTQALHACLEATNTPAAAITDVAVSSLDFAKTLARVFPGLKEAYYQIRRRKQAPGSLSWFKKRLKYRLTEYAPSALSERISYTLLRQRLDRLGLRQARLHLVDHHVCHAATAALCGGVQPVLVMTLDGLGDGRSGSIYTYQGGRLELVASLPARHSAGIFFEHVTNLLNMRELEDEGKVMALANYAYPVEDAHNPLLDLIQVEGLSFRCRHSALKMYAVLKKILWQYPGEQFAYMAQRTLELKVLELARNAVQATGLHRLCLAGGVFSNVKVNRLIRLLPEVEGCTVFPHMGDGGLALGAALFTNYRLNHVTEVPLPHVLLGPEYTDQHIEAVLSDSGCAYSARADIASAVADLLAAGEIVFWFQGRMEYGPRALGARSILARPDSEALKNALNLRLKKRVWYQPFCPSILAEDAGELLDDYDGVPNPFMTMAYLVKEQHRDRLRGVINIDGSCRPQIVRRENSLYRALLEHVKQRLGFGVLLNTSFNLHGEPLVCSPQDAVRTMIATGNPYLAIGNFLVHP